MNIDDHPYIDISPRIGPETPVFPGDQPYSRHISLDFRKGHHLLLSSITTTLHLGSHADAPNHYQSTGVGIDARHLRHYLGSCQVIDQPKVEGGLITKASVAGIAIEKPRVLFRTQSFPHHGPWTSDFASLAPDLIRYLADLGVITVGIDTPSIDPADSKSLSSHQAISDGNMAILEGLDLTLVAAGQYTLVALPLRLGDADASPVRAILLKDLPRV